MPLKSKESIEIQRLRIKELALDFSRNDIGVTRAVDNVLQNMPNIVRSGLRAVIIDGDIVPWLAEVKKEKSEDAS